MLCSPAPRLALRKPCSQARLGHGELRPLYRQNTGSEPRARATDLCFGRSANGPGIPRQHEGGKRTTLGPTGPRRAGSTWTARRSASANGSRSPDRLVHGLVTHPGPRLGEADRCPLCPGWAHRSELPPSARNRSKKPRVRADIASRLIEYAKRMWSAAMPPTTSEGSLLSVTGGRAQEPSDLWGHGVALTVPIPDVVPGTALGCGVHRKPRATDRLPHATESACDARRAFRVRDRLGDLPWKEMHGFVTGRPDQVKENFLSLRRDLIP